MTLATSPEVDTRETLARVLSLYDDGQCVDALRAGEVLGALSEWPGLAGRQIAGRLAHHLGAVRLSTLLHLRNFRAHRGDAGAQYYHLFDVHRRRGAVRAWMERRNFGPPRDLDDTGAIADYHGQCAQLLGALRDFDRAEEHLELARQGERLYWFVERAQLYEQEDRLDDALQAARDGLSANPRYPPNITSAAQYLDLAGKVDEALDLLRLAAAQTQSCSVALTLVRSLISRRLYDDVPDALARVEEVTPLREKAFNTMLISTRAEVAARRGDYEAALEYARQIQEPWFQHMVESIGAYLATAPRAGGAAPRVELGVPFVRQHHVTCAPATLSAISGFWEQPADHLTVAEEICYDGTSAYSERNWAMTNGWATKEFRVDWDSARALVDRGIPFTLTVSDAAAGHLQAVIGYDDPTGTLLVRDPMTRDTVELNARALIAHQASTGPRGMAMVPSARAPVLAEVHLPEEELHDLYYRMQLALETHRRDEAADCHARMQAAQPDHRLTLLARRTLAGYDNNTHEAVAAVDALLEKFPGDQRLQLDRWSLMRAGSTRAERLVWLQAAVARPATDALLHLEYARELVADDRLMAEALTLVWGALRRRPESPQVVHEWAELLRQMGKRDDALELYRLASCGAPAIEQFASSYFWACRWLKQTDRGLAYLEARVAAAGARSSAPAMTLFAALESLTRIDEAFAVLDAVTARRPDDGELRVFAARRFAMYSRTSEAETHLEAARGLVKQSAWLAESAFLAQSHGDRTQALERWRTILDGDPLNLEAHRMTALLLLETTTRDDGIAHLRTYCQRFPHHAGLHLLWYEWTATQPAADRESVLRHLLTIDPANSWTVRELAVNLTLQSRFGEALVRAEEAIALDASHAAGHSVKAFVLQAQGRMADAAECYRAALRLWVDSAESIDGLLDTCGDSIADRRRAMEFIRSELETQPSLGEGVLAFAHVSRGVLTPPEQLEALRHVHAKRPDLWQSWSALVEQLGEMGGTHAEEALALAQQATERFPRVPAAWLSRATVHRARLELEGETAAIESALEVNPQWAEGILHLCDALERSGRDDDARRALTLAVQRTPLVPALRVKLAQIAHRRGDVEGAVAILLEAIAVSPDHDTAWLLLAEWSGGDGVQRVLDLARSFAEHRPAEARAWMRLADMELRAGRADAALATIDRAIGIHPRNVDAHDFRATVLTQLRRFREARDACRPAVLEGGNGIPVALESRLAWIDARLGNMEDAIAKMRRVVERASDRPWAWAQLAEWWLQAGNLEEAARAVERWAWLDARNVVPLGWLGDLKQRMGDRAGAKEVFQRAMRLKPAYLFAGFEYLAIQQAESDFAGAARTLEILTAQAPADQILASRIGLAAAQGQAKVAMALMTELCLDPNYNAQAIVRATEMITDHKLLQELERTLRKVLDAPRCNPATPAVWAKTRARLGRLGSIYWYRRLSRMGDPGKQAIYEMLLAAGRRAQVDQHALDMDWHLALIRYHCRAWRSDDEYWGKVGYALVSRNHMRLLVRWMSDWQSRPKAEAWMLQNFTIGLLATRRDEKALAVLRHMAVTLSTGTDIGAQARLWCAFGACIVRDLPLAERLMLETPAGSLPESAAKQHGFAVALMEVLSAPRVRASYGDEHASALEVAVASTQGDPAAARLLALTRRSIADHVNSPWLRIVAWNYLNPRLSNTAILTAVFLTLGFVLAMFE